MSMMTSSEGPFTALLLPPQP